MEIKNILLILISILFQINCFNISPKPNLIIKEPSLITYMPKERSSYFGYTINLRPGSITIGAPRAQSSLELQSKVNETGSIYRYSFQKQTCEPYIFDRNGNHHSTNDEYAWNSERKDFQWLGGSMDGGKNDNDPLFVCAPRLCDDSANEYLIHGICYWIPNTLYDQPQNVRTIAPLRLKGSQVLEYRQNKYFYYMYGQQGISVHWTGRNEEVIIGAPGIHTWKGSIVHYKSKPLEDFGGLSKRDTNSKKIARQSNIEYVTEVPNPESWLQPADSYFGYSVSSGTFDSKNLSKILYVASAPQARKQSGEVYIFDIIKLGDQVTIKKYQTFHGDQFGEFFGYAVLSEDINNDGLIDLIVSAPLFATEKGFDTGAVYVFINKDNSNFQKQVIISPKNEPGRFGTTISKLGDINRDGYNDISIAAPFAGNGTVFIYLGSPDGLREIPSQVLIDPNIKFTKEQHMYGYGLSQGVDVDGNEYNDIAVGAPNSELVYLYKTYPVVKIRAWIGLSKREISMNEENLAIKACFMIETHSTKLKNQEINFHIKADQKFKRVKFLDGGNELKFTERATLNEKCKEFKANVKSILKYVFNPIELEIHYKLSTNIFDVESFCEFCAVVDPIDASVSKERIMFSTGCKDEICIADLKLTSSYKSKTFVIGSSNTLTIKYEIENNGETAYLPQLNITVSNRISFKRRPSACTLTNMGMICDLFKNSPMAKDDKDKIEILFDVTDIEGDYMEIVAEVLSAGKEFSMLDNIIKNFIMLEEYSTIEAIGSTNKNIISLEENSGVIEYINHYEIKNLGPSHVKIMEIILSIPISYVLPKSHNRISLIDLNNITVIAEYSTYNNLTVDFYQNNSLITQFFNHPKKIIRTSENNEGINFDSTNNGYAIEQESNENEYEHIMSRKKRATEAEYAKISQRKIGKSIADELIGQLPLNRTITFNCNDPEETLCIQAIIRVADFKHDDNKPINIDIKFKINLDEINKILVEEKDFFVISTGLNITKVGDENGDTIEVIQNLVHNIISKHQLYTTPIWIYIVSILAGILLLVLISYGLYRMGFFKRQKKEELAHLVRRSQTQHEPTEESPMNRPSD